MTDNPDFLPCGCTRARILTAGGTPRRASEPGAGHRRVQATEFKDRLWGIFRQMERDDENRRVVEANRPRVTLDALAASGLSLDPLVAAWLLGRLPGSGDRAEPRRSDSLASGSQQQEPATAQLDRDIRAAVLWARVGEASR